MGNQVHVDWLQLVRRMREYHHSSAYKHIIFDCNHQHKYKWLYDSGLDDSSDDSQHDHFPSRPLCGSLRSVWWCEPRRADLL
mmetsp:Transcript_43637/g.104045  ORF Transcript_43637/g.104045 Transcript_43637/m.104045 type:complete len:82 (+) Transcript_43637:3230-3475(+)